MIYNNILFVYTGVPTAAAACCCSSAETLKPFRSMCSRLSQPEEACAQSSIQCKKYMMMMTMQSLYHSTIKLEQSRIDGINRMAINDSMSKSSERSTDLHNRVLIV